jgi:signal transduction histidine kinase
VVTHAMGGVAGTSVRALGADVLAQPPPRGHARLGDVEASRARIVAAADEARRRIERDLHDGAQQRLVSLGFELRGATAMTPPELKELRARLSGISAGLVELLDELREVAHGIHPAVLTQGGLDPALKALARRSAIPVELDVRIGHRMPERVEVAVYYLVSEALTNAAKHSHASVVQVRVAAEEGVVLLAIRDDGVGGADTTRGSGLIGLRDRVEALDGTIEISSPEGGGTALRVSLPVGHPAHATPRTARRPEQEVDVSFCPKVVTLTVAMPAWRLARRNHT